MAGVRVLDQPLRVRDCAEWMGLSPQRIRKAIDEGIPVNGRTVRLEAERVTLSTHKRTIRIYEAKFTEFLIAIGWKHLPHRASVPPQDVQQAPVLKRRRA